MMPVMQRLNHWLDAFERGKRSDIERAEQRQRAQRNLRTALPWLVGLLLVLAAAVIVPDSIARLWWFRLLLGIALLPSVTVIGALRFRLVMQGDELQQRIELLAMGLTFVGALSALLLLMLQDIMDMHIRLQPLWVFWAFFGSYLLIGRALRGHYK